MIPVGVAVLSSSRHYWGLAGLRRALAGWHQSLAPVEVVVVVTFSTEMTDCFARGHALSLAHESSL